MHQTSHAARTGVGVPPCLGLAFRPDRRVWVGGEGREGARLPCGSMRDESRGGEAAQPLAGADASPGTSAISPHDHGGDFAVRFASPAVIHRTPRPRPPLGAGPTSTPAGCSPTERDRAGPIRLRSSPNARGGPRRWPPANAPRRSSASGGIRSPWRSLVVRWLANEAIATRTSSVQRRPVCTGWDVGRWRPSIPTGSPAGSTRRTARLAAGWSLPIWEPTWRISADDWPSDGDATPWSSTPPGSTTKPSAALTTAAREPDRLALIQEAVRWADATPWSLAAAPGKESLTSDPRLRILVAEVQSKCGSLFAAADASPHEERMTRDNARLRIRLAELSRTNATQERVILALADDFPDESTESWSARAGMLWCEEPEVNAARVVWRDPATPAMRPPRPTTRPASWTIPLESRSGVVAEVQLWLDPDQGDFRGRLERTRVVDAWQSWAARIADRDGARAPASGGRPGLATEHRGRGGADPLGEARGPRRVRRRRRTRVEQPPGGDRRPTPSCCSPRRPTRRRRDRSGSSSSQAQRTHRILRDLMFIARPLRAASPRLPSRRRASRLPGRVRGRSRSRGIRLTSEVEASDQPTWMDPDAFRHLADILIRNALQASTGGGKIQVRSTQQGQELRLSVADGGKGVSTAEGAHLFDPFYCGRQAGRGLGLGLPRCADGRAGRRLALMVVGRRPGFDLPGSAPVEPPSRRSDRPHTA